MPQASLFTPIGELAVTERGGAIVALSWARAGDDGDSPLLHAAMSQLAAYFDHSLARFDLPVRVEGTAFQKAVCDAMQSIPFGETRSYGDIARDLGVSAQAVGRACGGNPIPVIIPCHRVLGANGLGGYSGSGGVETKVALLRHEGAAGLLI